MAPWGASEVGEVLPEMLEAMGVLDVILGLRWRRLWLSILLRWCSFGFRKVVVDEDLRGRIEKSRLYQGYSGIRIRRLRHLDLKFISFENH